MRVDSLLKIPFLLPPASIRVRAQHKNMTRSLIRVVEKASINMTAGVAHPFRMPTFATAPTDTRGRVGGNSTQWWRRLLLLLLHGRRCGGLLLWLRVLLLQGRLLLLQGCLLLLQRRLLLLLILRWVRLIWWLLLVGRLLVMLATGALTRNVTLLTTIVTVAVTGWPCISSPTTTATATVALPLNRRLRAVHCSVISRSASVATGRGIGAIPPEMTLLSTTITSVPAWTSSTGTGTMGGAH